jgi:hypothetical protein
MIHLITIASRIPLVINGYTGNPIPGYEEKTMSGLKSDTLIRGAAAFLTLAATSAFASPFVSSSHDPHATVYLGVAQTAKQIYPVEIRAVDGKLTNRVDMGALWVAPGEYSFDVKVSEVVNLANIPGLQTSAKFGQDTHTLKLNVEAGQAYYIGAKFDASGKWQPVVWKTETSSS